jgi:hypothetical protein
MAMNAVPRKYRVDPREAVYDPKGRTRASLFTKTYLP